MRYAWVALTLVAGCTGLLDIDDFDYTPSETTTTSDGGGPGSGGSPGSGGNPGSGGMTTSQGGSSASGGGAGGMGGDSSVWFDDFNRQDDPDIGNGWIEKTADAFGLVNDQIVPLGGSGYRNNLVFRPQSEAVRDVEASIEFTPTASGGYPQMFIRVQYGTIATQGEYDGYNLWFPGSDDTVNLARQVGTASSTTLSQLSLSPPLAAGERYRMRMRADGDDPVELEGYIERWNGSDWVIIGSASHSDGDAARFDGAGAVGFASNNNTGFVYDNFSYRPL